MYCMLNSRTGGAWETEENLKHSQISLNSTFRYFLMFYSICLKMWRLQCIYMMKLNWSKVIKAHEDVVWFKENKSCWRWCSLWRVWLRVTPAWKVCRASSCLCSESLCPVCSRTRLSEEQCFLLYLKTIFFNTIEFIRVPFYVFSRDGIKISEGDI